jgi:hypothetical protein
MTSGPITPPLAIKKPQRREHHNDVYIDDYEWLRDKDSPEVIAHLEAENRYTEARTATQEPLRQQIFTEIKNRTQETDLSVPVRRGAFWYYTRTVEGQEYGIHCRAPISGPDDWAAPVLDGRDQTGLPGEQILLDDNVEAAGHEFFSLGSFDLNATRFECAPSRPVKTCQTRSRTRAPAPCSTRVVASSFTPPSTTPGVQIPSGDTKSAQLETPTRASFTSPTNDSGWASASPAAANSS